MRGSEERAVKEEKSSGAALVQQVAVFDRCHASCVPFPATAYPLRCVVCFVRAALRLIEGGDSGKPITDTCWAGVARSLVHHCNRIVFYTVTSQHLRQLPSPALGLIRRPSASSLGACVCP